MYETRKALFSSFEFMPKAAEWRLSMIIDVSKIVSIKGSSMKVSEAYSMDLLHTYSGDAAFKKPIQIDGTFNNVDGLLVFKGNLNTTLEFRCDRCTKPVDKHFFIPLEEHFSNLTVEHMEEKEILSFTGTKIDFTPVVISNLLLHLPMKIVCHKDCKSLCSKCGADLNKENCSCSESDINPQFANLQALFKTDKEV